MISFEGVSRKASRRSTTGTVVTDVTFRALTGQTTVLLGTPKATRQAVLRLLLRLDQPTDGVILFAGNDLRKTDGIHHRRSIGWLSGPPRLMPHRNVLDNVADMAKLAGLARAEAEERASLMLSSVGVADTWRRPSALSAVELVRVGLARAFVHEPQVVVLDDPFAGLDPVERPPVRDLLCALRESGEPTTVVLATGDGEDALALGHRLVLLVDGAIRQIGAPMDILNRPSPAAETLFGTSLGLRGLGFMTVASVEPDISAVVPVTCSAAVARRFARRGPSSWVLVVDDAKRPVGWADTALLSEGGVVTEIPLVSARRCVSDEDTLQHALDCIVSSQWQMVAKVDALGFVVGLLSQGTVSRHLLAARVS